MYGAQGFLVQCLLGGVFMLVISAGVTAAEPTTLPEPPPQPNSPPSPAALSPSDPDLLRLEDFDLEATLYLWGSSIEGTSATGGDIDVSFSDLFQDLNGALMGIVGVQKDKWSVTVDLIYMSVDAANSGTVTIPIGPGLARSANSQLDLKGWVVTPSLGYQLFDANWGTLHGLIGARYLWLKSSLDVTLDTLVGARTRQVSDEDGVWDAIFGIKGHMNLLKNFYLPYYLDVGTGQTDLTWQGFGGLGYRFRVLDVVAGWRYLRWNFKSQTVFQNLAFNGPVVGATFRF